MVKQYLWPIEWQNSTELSDQQGKQIIFTLNFFHEDALWISLLINWETNLSVCLYCGRRSNRLQQLFAQIIAMERQFQPWLTKGLVKEASLSRSDRFTDFNVSKSHLFSNHFILIYFLFSFLYCAFLCLTLDLFLLNSSSLAIQYVLSSLLRVVGNSHFFQTEVYFSSWTLSRFSLSLFFRCMYFQLWNCKMKCSGEAE